MSIRSATPQETFDHMLGSGATSYTWWVYVKMLKVIEEGVSNDWEAELTCENGEDATTTTTINHESVMKAAREILRKYLSDEVELGRSVDQVPHTVIRECAHLVFDADETDFDADSADCLLQLMVLGKIVFG
jgi:predicted component of viral defense system (DUF524 family)